MPARSSHHRDRRLLCLLSLVAARGAVFGGCSPASIRSQLLPYLLTLVETNAARRAYAAYDAMYIVALAAQVIERVRPDRWHIGGAVIALIGAAVIR